MNNNALRKILRNRTVLPHKIFMNLGARENECFLYQTRLAKKLNISNTTLNYWITNFKGEGLINKDLTLTPKGNRLFKYVWENIDKTIFRAHNIQLKLILRSCPVNYIKRYSDKIIDIISNGKYNGIKANLHSKYGNVTIMLYNRKKIICVLKDIYGNSDEEIAATLQLVYQELKEIIEFDFPGIKIASFLPSRIQTSHIALLDSIIAENFVLSGFTYESNTISVDKSHGRYELELTNPKNNLGGLNFLREIEKKIQKEVGK